MTDQIVPVVNIVSISRPKVWIENGFSGERYVVVQHEEFEPFDYAVFNYDYKYTSNAGTLDEAQRLAIELGATVPVQVNSRRLPDEQPPLPDDVVRRIAAKATSFADAIRRAEHAHGIGVNFGEEAA
ncbi:MAG: hypothetical protein LBH10_05170 [Burkholderiaceae bacterium]|jgi:hypothetical protein|nr:hypothetical protein [Burkholderiaceae bacterium]